MVLNASKNVTYNQVVEVLDMLKEVGGDRVALATLAGKSQIPNETVSPYPGLNPYYQPSPNQGYSGYGYNTPYPITPPTTIVPQLPSQPPTPPKN
jgi:biopolymer transport protein ExbD